MNVTSNIYSRHLCNWVKNEERNPISFSHTDYDKIPADSFCRPTRYNEIHDLPDASVDSSYNPLKYQSSSKNDDLSDYFYLSKSSYFSDPLLNRNDRKLHSHKNYTDLVTKRYSSSNKRPTTSSDYWKDEYLLAESSHDLGNAKESKLNDDDDTESSNTESQLKLKGNGTIGLANVGNTCFMNSILQCLSHTVKLRDYSIRFQFTRSLNKKSPLQGKLIKAYSNLINILWSGANSYVTPVTFKSQLNKLSSKFAEYEQHDSQEFLRFLLEELHQEINQTQKEPPTQLPDLSCLSPLERATETWKWYAMKDRSFVFDLFVGQLQSSIECVECGHVSLAFDPFWDLSIPVPRGTLAGTDKPVLLQDCLENFTKEEILEKDEMPVCTKCQVRQKMKKKLLIHRFPEILVIHLKRFREGRLFKTKQTSSVSFPVCCSLDLRSFASDICEDKESAVYKLFAVSNHSGTCNGGHYTAYCKNPDSEMWHEFDDSRVTSIQEHHICSKEAYVLFYSRKKSAESRC